MRTHDINLSPGWDTVENLRREGKAWGAYMAEQSVALFELDRLTTALLTDDLHAVIAAVTNVGHRQTLAAVQSALRRRRQAWKAREVGVGEQAEDATDLTSSAVSEADAIYIRIRFWAAYHV
jgi:hypothetical protein